MPWRRLLAYITGSVDEDLRLRNEYLAAENKILRTKLPKRIPLNDTERSALARIGKKLGLDGLAGLSAIVKPETILAWHRRLVAKKFDGTKNRGPGRPRIAKKIEELIVQFAIENKSWGYDRIVGALDNLGHVVSDETIGNVLRRNGIPPAPERKQTTTWAEFIRSHKDVLAATDFFSVEVWTMQGLVTYYVLFFIHLSTRKVEIAGITAHPNEDWMKQIARNVTMTDWGFLSGTRYLLHDRDGKYCPAFLEILKASGVKPLALPARSPNLNAFAERWIRGAKDEVVNRLIFFGPKSLLRALDNYVAHFHHERNHQGIDNVIPLPRTTDRIGATDGKIVRHQRLGGLLSSYRREVGSGTGAVVLGPGE